MIKANYLKKNYFYTPIISLFLIGALFLLFGCNDTQEKNTTFFGGKIKNPKGEYVYFYQGMQPLDSAKLNKQNRFFLELDSIKNGLYTFKHGPEYQYLYLEPKDSLLIYLNTWDFDESLIFSGKGSGKNNYLINLYLQQEKRDKNFKPNYKLNEEEFSALIDKGIQNELDNYQELIESEEGSPSELFEKLAKTSILFPFYTRKEYYPFYHKWQAKLKDFPEVSDEFYTYRKDIDLNDESLIDYAPYVVYVKTHLSILAHTESALHPEKSNTELNFMNIVKDKIHIESFKNELLAISLERSLSNQNLTDKEFAQIQNYFFEECTNEVLKNKLKRSISQKELIKKGDSLPNIIAYNTSGNQTSINDLTKNNTSVIYFWPKDLARIEMLNEKLVSLEENYPDILFIGIERNKNNEDWQNFVVNKKLVKSKQFNLSNTAENYSWFEGDMARTIIVNSKGIVENSYLFFNDKYFEESLQKLKKP